MHFVKQNQFIKDPIHSRYLLGSYTQISQAEGEVLTYHNTDSKLRNNVYVQVSGTDSEKFFPVLDLDYYDSSGHKMWDVNGRRVLLDGQSQCISEKFPVILQSLTERFKDRFDVYLSSHSGMWVVFDTNPMTVDETVKYVYNGISPQNHGEAIIYMKCDNNYQILSQHNKCKVLRAYLKTADIPRHLGTGNANNTASDEYSTWNAEFQAYWKSEFIIRLSNMFLIDKL